MSENKLKLTCGVVMPISGMEGCSESHWSEVLDLLTEAIDDAGFEANLVSNADDVGIIHKRIIQNLYDNPIVVCDVSGKNPNVMFELGLRLAFDKPTVIVKDDKTSYSFDTSAIEHLEYPRDLRFSSIVAFKQKLSEKISATYGRATTDPNYTTFLKHFGEFKVAKLDKKEVSGQEFILEELRAVRGAMRRLENQSISSRDPVISHVGMEIPPADINICMARWSPSAIDDVLSNAHAHKDISRCRIWDMSENHKHLLVDLKPGADIGEVTSFLRSRRVKRFLKKPEAS